MEDAKGSKRLFETKGSVSSNRKLLVKFHVNFDIYEMKNGIFYYLCIGSKLCNAPSCRYFVARQRKAIIHSHLCATFLIAKQLVDRKNLDEWGVLTAKTNLFTTIY